MRILGTIHNRRGDPRTLLYYLKQLYTIGELNSVAVVWSAKSGRVEPDGQELQREIRTIQDTLRDRVRRVHESKLAWKARAFLGRMYRSFQYEVLAALTMKRNHPDVKVYFVDEPSLRELRYQELHGPEHLDAQLGLRPEGEQESALRNEHELLRDAYQNPVKYASAVRGLSLTVLGEFPPHRFDADSRESYIAQLVKDKNPDVLIARWGHCVKEPSDAYRRLPVISRHNLSMRLSELNPTVQSLGEIENMIPRDKREA